MSELASGAFARVVLKLSGEALLGDAAFGIDLNVLNMIARQIRNAASHGSQVAVVVGGGNICRGSAWSAQGMDRATADHAGMLATLINGLALQDALERLGLTVRTQSAVHMAQICEPYIRRRAIRHLEKGRVVILAAGTGNPYMSTDTAAALRAVEIGAEVVLMAKNRVDGVYDADPALVPTARKFERLSYSEALSRRLAVMDSTALTLCMENDLPIIVFDLAGERSIERAIMGERIGTVVSTAGPVVLAGAVVG